MNLWLEWSDDPIGLAGTGRRVGATWDEVRAFVERRYPEAVLEGPFSDAGSGGKTYVMEGKRWRGTVREFPDDFEEKPGAVALAARVDAVRDGRITLAEYEASTPFARREEGDLT